MNAAVVEDIAFQWFFQPPLDGRPGLMMIVDRHPGPEHPDIRFITEGLAEVLWACESGLPKELHLAAFNIYCRDPFGLWFEVKTNVLSRRFQLGEPELSEADLQTLWESRKE